MNELECLQPFNTGYESQLKNNKFYRTHKRSNEMQPFSIHPHYYQNSNTSVSMLALWLAKLMMSV